MRDFDKTINYLNDSPENPDFKEEEITERLIPLDEDAPISNRKIDIKEPNFNQQESILYCPQCGYPNDVNAAFCMQCGETLKPVMDTSYDNSPYNRAFEEPDQAPSYENNPYQKLGGYLGFIVYANLILNPLNIIVLCWNFFQIYSTKDQYFIIGMQSYYYFLLLYNVINMATSIFYIWWALQIKNRNPYFLKYYDIVIVIVEMILAILEFIFNGVPAFIGTILGGGITVFIFTWYFVKSKRVRGYFGSDEYIRLNPFTKNLAK